MRSISTIVLILALAGCSPREAPVNVNTGKKAPMPNSDKVECLEWGDQTTLIGKMPYTMKVCKKWRELNVK